MISNTARESLIYSSAPLAPRAGKGAGERGPNSFFGINQWFPNGQSGFITAGSFTPAAVKEATRDDAPPIDLVDGDELAEKLKGLALGVKTEQVERISVDTSWFEGI